MDEQDFRIGILAVQLVCKVNNEKPNKETDSKRNIICK